MKPRLYLPATAPSFTAAWRRMKSRWAEEFETERHRIFVALGLEEPNETDDVDDEQAGDIAADEADDVDEVVIEGRDQANGFGGTTVTVALKAES